MFLQKISFNEEDAVKVVFVDFRIRLDDFDPLEVTSRLGIQPSRSWATGEKYLGKARDPETQKVIHRWSTRPWGMWAISTEGVVHAKRVELHVLHLLDLLEPKKDSVKYYLEHSRANSISFYIRWEPFEGHGSYRVSSGILQRMAALCHFVDYSFISTEPAENDSQ